MKRRLYNVLASLIIAILLGTIMMILAYSVPVSLIRKHVVESKDIFENEAWGYGYSPRVSTSYPDHVTDALMILEAAAPTTGLLIQDALSNTWVGLDSGWSVEALTNFDEMNPNDGMTYSYSRYWHGYLVWLKPFLSVMSYSEIRIIAMWIQTALLFYALYLLSKQEKKLMFSLFCSYMFLNPITAAMSIQYASVYTITIIIVIALLKLNLYKSEKCYLLFMWGGMAIAFFDFFTYPVVALGVPLIISVALNEENSVRVNVKNVVDYTIAYIIGYGGMWCGKWVLAGLFLNGNSVLKSFRNAFGQTIYRMSAGADENVMTVSYVLRQVLMHLNNKPMKIFVLLFFCTIAMLLLSRRCVVNLDFKIVPILIVSLYPFIWYMLVKNHSATHSRIEQREMAVSIMAVIYIISRCLKSKNRKVQ